MRLLSLLAAAGLIAGGAVAAAPAASAAGTCSMYVPSRFSIGQPYRDITVPQGPNCAAARVVEAFWFAYHPTKGDVGLGAGYQDSARSTKITLVDTMPIGRWTWQPSVAFDANFHDVYLYTTYTDVRLASYGRVTPTRSGTKVNVKTTAMRYWQGGHKFIGWSGARGQIQYRTPGTTTWRALKDVYSTSTGAYSYTYTTSAVRDYRVVFGDVSTMWGSTSPIVRK
jgi:hypothetical protein